MRVAIDKDAFKPTRAHDTDAGLDLYSPVDCVVPAMGSAVIHTGVHVEVPACCAGLLVSKSGLNVNSSITSTGLIDENFSWEIVVKLYNHGTVPVNILRGQKVSQLVIIPVRYEKVKVVEAVMGGGRWNNGFGSTGP